jgi:NADPH:quinone reductase-like Zn-dependent oxidoreductase
MSTQHNEPETDSRATPEDQQVGSIGPVRSTMQATVRDAYGSADLLQVREVPTPAAAAGEVLIRVQAAGVDRGAWHVMTGRPYLMRLAGFGVRRPKDPGLGTEIAGVVEAVGASVAGACRESGRQATSSTHAPR